MERSFVEILDAALNGNKEVKDVKSDVNVSKTIDGEVDDAIYLEEHEQFLRAARRYKSGAYF